MPAIGLFDMDGCLVDHNTKLFADLKKLAAPCEPELANDEVEGLAQLTAVDMWQAERSFPHIKARMDLIRSQPDWWFNLQPIESGMKLLHAAEDLGFCCHILTKGPKSKPLAWKEKLEWCHLHLGGRLPVHITMDKGMVYGKFLFDDYPNYMLRWLKYRPHGLGIMPVTTYNKDFNHFQVIKYDGNNLAVVIKALTLCRDRKRGEPLRIPAELSPEYPPISLASERDYAEE